VREELEDELLGVGQEVVLVVLVLDLVATGLVQGGLLLLLFELLVLLKKLLSYTFSNFILY